ncbi:MAG: hypothetical protein HQM16_13665 [Deltaproteobacteria bacterium]|nr:hypothetical protein [Deltaproteobacteria bacterium]
MTIMRAIVGTPVGSGAYSSGHASQIVVSDLHLEHLGPRTVFKNPIIDRFPVSNRTAISLLTAPAHLDALLRSARQAVSRKDLCGLQILGDATETPSVREATYIDTIIKRQALAVMGYARGNHSSAHAFGSLNTLSFGYQAFVHRYFPIYEEMLDAGNGAENVLTPQKTMRVMHDVIHHDEKNGATPETLNVRVAKGRNGAGYQLEGRGAEYMRFDEVKNTQVFQTFWCSQPGDKKNTKRWECLINYHEADTVPFMRRHAKVCPIYMQAFEEVRFVKKDGTDVPVYEITLDGLDHGSIYSAKPYISVFQIRLVEAFIDEMLKQNPEARFKISSHFPMTMLPRASKKEMKKLLAREEIILVKAGHTHSRDVTDLNKEFKLKRESDLIQITLPAFIDDEPLEDEQGQYHDGRAVGIERMKLVQNSDGTHQIEIEFMFKALSPEDVPGVNAEVRAQLADYRKKHGYVHAPAVMKEFKKMWPRLVATYGSNLKRTLWRLFKSVFPWTKERFKDVYEEMNTLQDVVDSLTSLSTIQMFHEVDHLIPFLESVSHFLRADDDHEMAVKAQLTGLTEYLKVEKVARRRQFIQAIKKVAPPSELRGFNDLYIRKKGGPNRDVHGTGAAISIADVAKILLELKADSPARAFAILAGMEASLAEFEFEGGAPTEVANRHRFVVPV